MANNQNATLKILHIATGLKVEIQKYLFTEFSDTIDTQYNSVQTFGRMDPIVNYQGATRKISLGIKRNEQNETSRTMSHQFISRLQKMQYPVYESGENALTIQRPPIVAVKLGNLIRDGNGGPLICAMNGFAFTPSVGFTPEDSPYVRFGGESSTIATGSGGSLSFKEYNFRFDFTALHQSPAGFQEGSAIYDPDNQALSPAMGDMKFLGGYQFGPHETVAVPFRVGGRGAMVYSSDASKNNVQAAADIDDLFKKLGF